MRHEFFPSQRHQPFETTIEIGPSPVPCEARKQQKNSKRTAKKYSDESTEQQKTAKNTARKTAEPNGETVAHSSVPSSSAVRLCSNETPGAFPLRAQWFTFYFPSRLRLWDRGQAESGLA